LFVLFSLNSHCRSPAASLLHSVFKNSFCRTLRRQKYEKYFIAANFSPSFYSTNQKREAFFLLPFTQNRNFSPNNLVVSFEKCNFSASFYIEKCKKWG